MSVHGDRSNVKVSVNALIKLSLFHYCSPVVIRTNDTLSSVSLYKIYSKVPSRMETR